MNVDAWEFMSYVVTVLGLPVAVAVFVYEKRKQRLADKEKVYESLSARYHDFLRLALENPDLKLLSQMRTAEMTADQRERMLAIFGLLIALFERAYLLIYNNKMTGMEARRWESWVDFMQEWCERADFREAIPDLLTGEDPEFSVYLTRLAREFDARKSGDREIRFAD